jgi:Phage ABA sandwich domain
MTRDEIMAMKPGRVLDALVADKMGWTAYQERRSGRRNLCVAVGRGNRKQWGKSHVSDPKSYKQITCVEASKIGFYGNRFPEYSTEIAAAWEVAEKIIDNAGIDVVLTVKMDRRWRAIIDDDGERIAEAKADTAPEAICKAALMASL